MAIYSHSRINTFENCPLQFKYRYIDRIRSEEEGVEAFMGSRVHEVLEKLYADLQYSKTDSLEELLELFRQNWQKNWHDKIVIIKRNFTAEDYQKTGERCIKDYYRRHAPFNEGVTLGLEKAITIRLADGRYMIKGFIDRLVKTGDGQYEIHDYKTSRQVPPQYYADQDRQLALYQIAVQGTGSDVQEVELVWHYLANDVELRSRRTPEQLEDLKKSIIKQIQKIEAAEEFEPQESALCPWCVYQYLCPLKKQLFATERMIAEEFLADNGVILVDDYALLKEKEKELKNQIEGMKQALTNFAQKEKLSVIIGTNHKVKMITRRDRKIIDEEHLEEVIKENHLWEAVSKINKKLFENLLNSKKIDSKLTAQLKEHLDVNVSQSPYLYKLKDIEK